MLNHEALDVHTLPLSGYNIASFSSHGTAALGIIMMKENCSAGPGITPHANGFVVSQWRPDGSPNEADAVLCAIYYLSAGDVLLLETQSFEAGTGNRLWPVEIQDAVYATILLATALGIIVVEAAGNGNIDCTAGNNLDLYSVQNKKILNPADIHYRDSGAILVGAATSTVPHCRIAGSNFGKRVNCYAWGEAVTTAGNFPGIAAKSTTDYTSQFNGTSAASAIIAGAAIAIQCILKEAGRPLLKPAEMRKMLGDASFGTASANGTGKDKIGAMPDLKKIIDHLLSQQVT